MKKLLALAAFAVFMTAFPSYGAETYRIDPLHTSVLLKANHLGFSNVYMRVNDVSGEFTFDRENPQESSVTVTMRANSIDGFDTKFNEHLHSADFFDAANFPVITFASREIKVTGENTAVIHGVLTIKGLAQPAVLSVTFNKAGENPFGKDYRSGFSATGQVKRSDYGITYALPAVADEVGIIIETEGVRVGE